MAFYDGRASAAENWFERTGVAVGSGPDAFTPEAGPTPAGETVRYVSFAESLTGTRVYWEASRSDGANELRTAKVPRPESPQPVLKRATEQILEDCDVIDVLAHQLAAHVDRQIRAHAVARDAARAAGVVPCPASTAARRMTPTTRRCAQPHAGRC